MRITIEIDEQTEASLNELVNENNISISDVIESFVYYEVVRRQNWKDMCKGWKNETDTGHDLLHKGLV